MFRKFLTSNDGNMVVVFAIGILPVMTGVLGAIDFVSMNNKASEVQNALDTAAVAIATKLHSGMSQQELDAYGDQFFRANVQTDSRFSVSFSFVDPSAEPQGGGASPQSQDLVKVVSNLSMSGLLGQSISWKTQRESVVKLTPGEPACVLALDRQASEAIKIQGSTEVSLAGCVLASNSNASDSIGRGGAAKLDAKCVSTVGGTSGIASNSNVELACGEPKVNQYPAYDPLASVVPPAYTACQNVPGGKTKTLSPGTYCNKNISGEVTLEPGTYILRGGQINLGGNGTLLGHGVTIFLMEDAQIGFNANQIVDLTAPTSGDYAGIAIYQAAGNTSPMVLNGGAGTNITGFIYAPSADIQFAGNASTGANKCVRLVGRTIELTGNSAVSADCEAELAGKKIYAGHYVRIAH